MLLFGNKKVDKESYSQPCCNASGEPNYELAKIGHGLFTAAQGHRTNLMRTARREDKLLIQLSSIAKRSGKTAKKHCHVR